MLVSRSFLHTFTFKTTVLIDGEIIGNHFTSQRPAGANINMTTLCCPVKQARDRQFIGIQIPFDFSRLTDRDSAFSFYYAVDCTVNM